jgi:hypothetical protein
MKKLFSILAAVCLMFCVAGNAAADIAAGNLVAVFYNEADNSVAFDLGAITPGSDVIVDTNGLLEYFTSPDLTYEDISVGIFAAEAGYSNWFATTSTDTPAISTSSLVSFMSGATAMYTNYSDKSVLASADTKSYNTVMNSSGTTPGYYAGFNPIFAAGEATLDAGGNFLMYVHNFDITTADPGATITVSTVPVPAAVWLLGSGLLGLVGIRRRNA